jgi:hypothetical protein
MRMCTGKVVVVVVVVVVIVIGGKNGEPKKGEESEGRGKGRRG